LEKGLLFRENKINTPTRLKITKILLDTEEGEDPKLQALAEVELEGQLVLTGIRLYRGLQGPFIQFPLDPNLQKGVNRSLFYCSKTPLRKLIENAIILAYTEYQERSLNA
jgi:DNA-binding cell septation regulator SpoVG